MVEWTDFLSIVLAYLIGSIPSAVWISRWFHNIDIREFGSKNAGLTNVYRVLGWKPATPVMLMDLSKGFLAPYLAMQISGGEWIPLIAGLVCILGHTFTVFANFRGGKGVLTALGVFLCLGPVEGLSAFGIWIVVAVTTRYVSLASIAACFALGTFLTLSFLNGNIHWNTMVLGWTIAVFVIVKHKANIGRLLNGTENRFKRSDKDSK